MTGSSKLPKLTRWLCSGPSGAVHKGWQTSDTRFRLIYAPRPGGWVMEANPACHDAVKLLYDHNLHWYGRGKRVVSFATRREALEALASALSGTPVGTPLLPPLPPQIRPLRKGRRAGKQTPAQRKLGLSRIWTSYDYRFQFMKHYDGWELWEQGEKLLSGFETLRDAIAEAETRAALSPTYLRGR